MPVDRKRWRNWYFAKTFPTWQCLQCGGLISRTADQILEWETAESRGARDHDAWEPEWINGRFMVQFACSSCGDRSCGCGWWDSQEDWDRIADAPELTSRYHPEYILPAPRLIAIPDGTPDSIADQLDLAFAVLWADPGSSGNRIRSAIERLLDDQRVPKVPSSKNRSTRLTLHRRLELFAGQHAEAGELLMAAKWIGNAGSHRELTRDDVFDGLDLLEHALEQLYSPVRHAVRRLARSINRTKRPRGGRRTT